MSVRFLVDINVGRLAKWLRVLGYDAAVVPGVDDGELVRLALQEDRVLLTRDTGIVRRRLATNGPLQVVVVRSENLWEQLRQVVQELALAGDQEFTRCIDCNLALEELSREEAQALVPPYVSTTQQGFRRCPRCGRVYWRGTHWRNMRQELARVFQEKA